VHKDSLVTQPAGGIDTIADVVDHAVEGGDGLEAMCSIGSEGVKKMMEGRRRRNR
jgi:hypothetical protein